MVFQKSNPFPMTIYENVSYGLKLAGVDVYKRQGVLLAESFRPKGHQVVQRIGTDGAQVAGLSLIHI